MSEEQALGLDEKTLNHYNPVNESEDLASCELLKVAGHLHFMAHPMSLL